MDEHKNSRQPGERPYEQEMLIELFDLNLSPSGGENWAESARWIKYEEDIEGVDKHWGRPHVAYLTFHSLTQLRQCFNKGVLLLDLQHAADMADIMNRLAIAMASDTDEESGNVNKVLHTIQLQRFNKDSSRHFSRASRAARTGMSRRGSVDAFAAAYGNPAGPDDFNPDGEIKRADSTPRPARKISQSLQTAQRKISSLTTTSASEHSRHETVQASDEPVLCQVYAGMSTAVKDVKFAMIRLADAVDLPDARSAALPLRFLFVLIGPPMLDVDYHELGRAVATLMTDASFKKLAYEGASKEAFLKGIDHFLDFSIVIPPGDIDSHDLLSAEDVQKALIYRRHLKTMTSQVDWEAKKKISVKRASVQHDAPKPDLVATDAGAKRRRGRVDHVVDALRRSGRIFGGTIDDIKYRAPYYWRDFKDALHFKVVTATLFMFFANFASAVAFGEVMEEKTDGYMGTTEMLMAHCICGVVWGFIACQPLCIQAAVGPFLVLEASLYAVCKSQGLDFLATRVWTGLWTVILMVVTAAVEGSFLVRYLTRFTEDIFTSLIAFIFIWEALKYLYQEVTLHPLHNLPTYCGIYQKTVQRSSFNGVHTNSTNGTSLNGTLFNATLYNETELEWEHEEEEIADQPNTALLSFILVIVTFLVAYNLKKLGMSIYFGRFIRKTLSDFGVPLAVFLVILIYQLFFRDTHIRHVDALPYFSLTNSSLRTWIVNPLGPSNNPLPVWIMFASILPALVVAILVFAEVEIIELLLAKKETGLQRPHGFHWDLIVCGAMVFVCSLFGMPWMCPGAVQSTAHAGSLAVMKKTAPGAAPQMDYVVEQRVSCMLVGLLHGAAAFAGVALVLIPVPVLFGLFLFLGVMGMINIRFVHRLVMFFVPRKYFPDNVKAVSMLRLHLYTFVQLMCFGVLWAVNMVKSIALAFPLVLTLIALFRMFVMTRIFTPFELQVLDGKPEEKPIAVNNAAADDSDAPNDNKIIL